VTLDFTEQPENRDSPLYRGSISPEGIPDEWAEGAPPPLEADEWAAFADGLADAGIRSRPSVPSSPSSRTPSRRGTSGGFQPRRKRAHSSSVERTPCPYPQHLVVEDSETGEQRALKVRCRRWTCPSCRVLLAADAAGRVLEAFKGREIWVEEIKAGEWNAYRMRKSRQGEIDHVRTPRTPFSHTVLTTQPVTDNAVKITEDRAATVLEIMGSRPDYHKGEQRPGHLSASRGFLSSAAEKDEDSLWSLIGTWVEPEGVKELGDWLINAALDAGLEITELAATDTVEAGVQTGVDPDPAALAAFHGRIGFVEFGPSVKGDRGETEGARLVRVISSQAERRTA